MPQELVTVIVPVYNIRSEMLKKCIGSICRQTYMNLEIILVDDGSTDVSGKLLDCLAKKDNRIKVIHKKNGGVSDARNVGLEVATGVYICFVDSDDWLTKDSVERLYTANEQADADFCVGAIKYISTIHDFNVEVPPNMVATKGDSASLYRILSSMDTTPLGKLYKSEIIHKNSIRFPLGIHLGEDTLFIYSYIKNCSTICAVCNNVYYYNFFVQQSLSRGKLNVNVNYVISDAVSIFSQIFAEDKNDPYTEKAVQRRALVSFVFLCKHYVQCIPEREYDFVIEKLKESYLLMQGHLSKDYVPEEWDANGTAKHRLLSQFLEDNDYDSLYWIFYKHEDEIRHKTIKDYIKQFYAAIKYFYCFYIEK